MQLVVYNRLHIVDLYSHIDFAQVFFVYCIFPVNITAQYNNIHFKKIFTFDMLSVHS